MSKDTQTTIAGIVGAVALLVQWVLSTFFQYKLEVGADVLNAIAILAGIFVAWKVGKTGNNTSRSQDGGISNSLPVILVLILIFGFTGMASAQWKKGNAVTVAWDAAEGATSYKIYAKPEAGGDETFMVKVDGATQGTATFITEGRWLIGVSSVKTVGGTEVESATKCWSNDNTCTFQGIAFGLEYIVPPQTPKNLRPVN